MIQKFHRWGECDQRWHRGQLSPAGCSELGCMGTKLGFSPTVAAQALCNPCCRADEASESEEDISTTTPWPPYFCHGSQHLPFNGCCFIYCSPLMRKALGTAWNRVFCSDPRGWHCKMMLSRVKHFHSTYVLIWKCEVYKGCFPFLERTLFWGSPFSPPQQEIQPIE